MNNYDVMRRAAEARFCTYDLNKIMENFYVFRENDHICTTFLGEPVRIGIHTGALTVGGRPGNFGETLTIFDWLCDRKPGAVASGEFCPVSSLPGVLVSGGNLVMNLDALAAKVDQDPAAFLRACEALGGEPTGAGDMGFEILAFPDLPLQVKFYHADDEFPASMTLLWDKNTLQFIRYETVYYLAGCLRQRLDALF